jgi:glycosyltransferase involved in cell wall biosynthesis
MSAPPTTVSLRPIVVVGQTPPPVHGQSIMIQAMLDALRPKFDVAHVRMQFSGTPGETGRFSLFKVFHLFALVVRLRRVLRGHPGAVLYYPPAPPNLAPVLRDLVLLTAARGLAGRVVFHFHAGGLGDYLSRHPWLRRRARRALFHPDAAVLQGPSCPRDDLALEAAKTYFVPNGRDIEALPPSRGGGSRPVVLYVGLHTRGKGLFDLLETVRRCRDLGVDAEFRTVGTWTVGRERQEW